MITIELKEDEITGVLNRLSRALTDMSPVMQDIGEEWLESTQGRMLRGEQPDGAPFAPRSQATLDRYRQEGGSFGLPLNRTRNMIDQLSTSYGVDFVEISSNEHQSAVMQFGAAKGSFGAYSGTGKNGHPFSGIAPWADIPARPFLGISDDDQHNIVATISEWLDAVAKAEG